MNNFLKALILGCIVFFIHSLVLLLLIFFYTGSFGYYGLAGGIMYFFMIGFWGYYSSILIYLFISDRLKTESYNYVIAFGICCIGYIGYRAGDIIDNDFIHNFKLLPFLLFLLTSWIIVRLDQLIGNTKEIPQSK